MSGLDTTKAVFQLGFVKRGISKNELKEVIYKNIKNKQMKYIKITQLSADPNAQFLRFYFSISC